MFPARYQRGDRIQLAVDLSHYHPALKNGTVGEVFGRSIRGDGTIMRCRFPGAGRWDVPVKYLQEPGQASAAAATQAAAQAGATAEAATGAGDQGGGSEAAPEGEPDPPQAAGRVYGQALLRVGPRGGYRFLQYEVYAAGQTETVSLSTRPAIVKALAELAEAGVRIDEEVET